MNACPSSAMIVSVLLRLDPPPLSLWPGFLAENQLIFDCDSLGHNLNFNDQFRLLWSFMWFKINYKPLWSPLDTLFRFWEVWAFGQLKSLRNFNQKIECHTLCIFWPFWNLNHLTNAPTVLMCLSVSYAPPVCLRRCSWLNYPAQRLSEPFERVWQLYTAHTVI